MKTLKLQTRMLLTIGGLTFLILIAMITIIGLRTNKIITGDLIKQTETQAEQYAFEFKNQLEEALFTTRALANVFEGYEGLKVENRRNTLNLMLKQTLMNNKDYLSVWVTIEPDVLEGNDKNYINIEGGNNTGRLTTTYFRENNQILLSDALDDEIETADYYQVPKAKNEEVIIEPYFYTYTENGTEFFMTSIVVPIKDKSGKFLGVVGIDIDLKPLQAKLAKYQQPMALISNGGIIAAHFDATRIGKTAVQTEVDMIGEVGAKEMTENIKNGKKYSQQFFTKALNAESYLVVAPFEIGNTQSPWGFGYSVPMSVALQKAKETAAFTLVLSIVGLLILIIVLFSITKSITRPILKSIKFAQEISQGNLTSNINTTRTDEIGNLANALNTMVTKLKDITSNIENGAIHISAASHQISGTTQNLSQSASEQASSVEEVSSTIEEMASNIQQNTDNAMQTNKIAMVAQQGIKQASERSQKAVEANRMIASKIVIINDIAFQTNLLALNAAVEAARAGESGRGFAVVAAEVRRLAERSKIAADEIVTLAAESLSSAESAGAKLAEILPEIEKTASLLQEISAASIEQNHGASQVNNAIQQMSSISQQNAAASEELATNAEELSSQAEQLKDLISFFKFDDDNTKSLKQTITNSNIKSYLS